MTDTERLEEILRYQITRCDDPYELYQLCRAECLRLREKLAKRPGEKGGDDVSAKVLTTERLEACLLAVRCNGEDSACVAMGEITSSHKELQRQVDERPPYEAALAQELAAQKRRLAAMLMERSAELRREANNSVNRTEVWLWQDFTNRSQVYRDAARMIAEADRIQGKTPLHV